jgi:hypothetical protein
MRNPKLSDLNLIEALALLQLLTLAACLLLAPALTSIFGQVR